MATLTRIASPAKAAATLVLILSIIIGTISKYQPTLFFRIPHIGFIFWAATGHRMPPYFDPAPMEQPYFDRLVHDGDTILGSLPKAGTVWLHYIIHLLKNGGDDTFSDRLMDHVGSAEFMLYPENTVEERVSAVQSMREREAKRSVRRDKTLTHFSHLSPADQVYGLNVTLHPKVRYVVAMRNPLEIIQSAHSFLNMHTADFRRQWGGFPPRLPNKEAALEFVLGHKEFVFMPAVAWWQVRHEPNVLLVNFVDLKTDHRGQVERIARFLDIPDVTPDLIDATVEKSTFAHMKRREKEVPGIYSDLHGRPGRPKFFTTEQHLGKGKSLESGEYYTPEMMLKYEKTVGEMLGPFADLVDYLGKGGVY